ncbi:MAG: hypothetical protein ACX94C_11635 [Phycisphaerales bacterium]
MRAIDVIKKVHSAAVEAARDNKTMRETYPGGIGELVADTSHVLANTPDHVKNPERYEERHPTQED